MNRPSTEATGNSCPHLCLVWLGRKESDKSIYRNAFYLPSVLVVHLKFQAMYYKGTGRDVLTTVATIDSFTPLLVSYLIPVTAVLSLPTTNNLATHLFTYHCHRSARA